MNDPPQAATVATTNYNNLLSEDSNSGVEQQYNQAVLSLGGDQQLGDRISAAIDRAFERLAQQRATSGFRTPSTATTGGFRTPSQAATSRR